MSQTRMLSEIHEIPRVARDMTTAAMQDSFVSMAALCKKADPAVIVTVARGSSRHACTYLNHASANLLGLLSVPLNLSFTSVFDVDLQAKPTVAFAVSQSGASPDLVQSAKRLTQNGVPVIALTNSEQGALAKSTPHVVDFQAGPEIAVAATKSFFASVLSGLWIFAHWAQDTVLMDELTALPERLELSATESFEDLERLLISSPQMVLIGRGVGMGIVNEIALKAQELCGIHASAYSAAELLHGPRAMIGPDVPVVAFARSTAGGLDQALYALSEQGVSVTQIGHSDTVLHPLVDPLLDLIALYTAMERASLKRGRSPDTPALLSKETITV